jgi:predicted GTPase
MVQGQPNGRLKKLGSFLRPWWKFILRGALLALPTLALLPLGIKWLFERGIAFEWFLIWAVAACLALVMKQLWKPTLPPISFSKAEIGSPQAEKDARTKIEKILDAMKEENFTDKEAIQAVVLQVVNAVSSSYHPGKEAPELRITLPELLRAIEVTSGDYRREILRNFPSARDIPFATINTAFGLYDKGTVSWRVFRFLNMAFIKSNPVAAIGQEILHEVNQSLMSATSSAVKNYVVKLAVKQIGEAAILLYSGKCRDESDLRGSSKKILSLASSTSQQPSRRLRISIVGQKNTGKSTLLNALLGSAQSLAGQNIETKDKILFAADLDDIGAIQFIDTPGVTQEELPPLERIVEADLVLWTIALHRADRAPDVALANALRQWAREHVSQRVPPIVFVLTHIDRLDPPGEWLPPYDLEGGQRPKEQLARRAMQTVRQTMQWPEARWTPTMLGEGGQHWNIETLRKQIVELRNTAEQTQHAREIATRSKIDKLVDAVDSARQAIQHGTAYVFRHVTRLFKGGRAK